MIYFMHNCVCGVGLSFRRAIILKVCHSKTPPVLGTGLGIVRVKVRVRVGDKT